MDVSPQKPFELSHCWRGGMSSCRGEGDGALSGGASTSAAAAASVVGSMGGAAPPSPVLEGALPPSSVAPGAGEDAGGAAGLAAEGCAELAGRIGDPDLLLQAR